MGNQFSTNEIVMSGNLLSAGNNVLYFNGAPILNSGDIASSYYLNSNPSGFISNNNLSNYLISVPSIDITDHFIQRQDGGTTYQSPWLQSFGGNGGGAVFSTELDTGGHPGIIRLNLTATSSAYAGLTSQPSLLQLGYGPALFETMIKWGDLSGQRSYILAGLIDAGQTSTVTDGVGFKFQNNSGFSTGVITPFIRRNSSETTSPVVVTGDRDTWYYLSCSVNSNATVASFSIKNETGLSIINTELSGINMPTGASRQVGAGIIYYRNQGVTSNYMYSDWYRLKLQPFA